METEMDFNSKRMFVPIRKKKTMKLSRALSDLVKYTQSVGMHDIEAQGEWPACTEQQAVGPRGVAPYLHEEMRRNVIHEVPQKGNV